MRRVLIIKIDFIGISFGQTVGWLYKRRRNGHSLSFQIGGSSTDQASNKSGRGNGGKAGTAPKAMLIAKTKKVSFSRLIAAKRAAASRAHRGRQRRSRRPARRRRRCASRRPRRC